MFSKFQIFLKRNSNWHFDDLLVSNATSIQSVLKM